MTRFCLLEPLSIFIHHITFTCSPLSQKRFREERHVLKRKFRENQMENYWNPERRQSDKPDWGVLFRPLDLIRLIKRYHMCGNLFIVTSIVHLMLLFHITIKCAIHTFITGSNQEKLEYSNSIYYPHLLGAFPKPYLFNNLFLALSLLLLSTRLLAARQLIRGAIINANRYKEIKISQLNLTGLTKFYLTPKQWLKFLTEPYKHLNQVKTEPRVYWAHYKLNESIHDNHENSPSTRDLKFCYNVVDFNDCYEWLGNLPPRKKKYQDWQSAKPVHRLPSTWLTAAMLVGLTTLGTAVLFPTFLATGVLILELRSSLSSDAKPTIFGVIARYDVHLSEPLHIVRISELVTFALLLVPHNFGASMLYVDTWILAARIRKLVRILYDELEFVTQTAILELGKQTMMTPSNQTKYDYFEKKDNDNLSTKRNFNARIRQEITVMRILCLEFYDIKAQHQPYVNFLILGTGICMSYIITLSTTVTSLGELSVLLSLFVSCFFLNSGVLACCVYLERLVS